MDNSLEELSREIAVTGYKINRYCDLLILGKTKKADNFVFVVNDALQSVMPKIIYAYSEVECLKGEDSGIWVEQLKRIIDALSSDDDIRKIEVLKIETIENFRILMEVLEQQNG